MRVMRNRIVSTISQRISRIVNGMSMENAIDNLEDALDKIDEAKESISEAVA